MPGTLSNSQVKYNQMLVDSVERKQLAMRGDQRTESSFLQVSIGDHDWNIKLLDSSFSDAVCWPSLVIY